MKKEEKKKTLFPWAIAIIFMMIFGVLFLNGYLIYKDTGIDDEDITVFE